MAFSGAKAVVEPLRQRAGHRGHLVDTSGRPLSCAEVAEGLSAGGKVASELERSIAGTAWNGVFWECRPMRGTSAADSAFEWMVLHSPAVARLEPDSRPFREQLRGAVDVAIFDNLGRDAVLVAPVQGGDGERSAHLVEFLRTAGARRRAALWKAVGAALTDWFHQRPEDIVWLSTSGLGVSWLHVRLDSRPKYITWRPYREPPPV